MCSRQSVKKLKRCSPDDEEPIPKVVCNSLTATASYGTGVEGSIEETASLQRGVQENSPPPIVEYQNDRCKWRDNCVLCQLPDIVIARIVSYLDVGDRLRLVGVCCALRQAINERKPYLSAKALSIFANHEVAVVNGCRMEHGHVSAATEFLMTRCPNVTEVSISTTRDYSHVQDGVSSLFCSTMASRGAKPVPFSASVTRLHLNGMKWSTAIQIVEHTVSSVTKLALDKLVVSKDDPVYRLYAAMRAMRLTEVDLGLSGSDGELKGAELRACLGNKSLRRTVFRAMDRLSNDHICDLWNGQSISVDARLTIVILKYVGLVHKCAARDYIDSCSRVEFGALWSGLGMNQVQTRVLHQVEQLHFSTREVSSAVLDGLCKMPLLRDFGIFLPTRTFSLNQVKVILHSVFAAMERNSIDEMVVSIYPFHDVRSLPLLISSDRVMHKCKLLTPRLTDDNFYDWFKLTKHVPHAEHVITLKVRPSQFE